MAFSKGSESITQGEHISPEKTGDNIEAKRVAGYVWNGTSWQRQSSTSGTSKATAAYSINNIAEDATYKYFGFEDADGAWYIMRKTLADSTFLYAKGASAYATAWTGRASQTYASYASTF